MNDLSKQLEEHDAQVNEQTKIYVIVGIEETHRGIFHDIFVAACRDRNKAERLVHDYETRGGQFDAYGIIESYLL